MFHWVPEAEVRAAGEEFLEWDMSYVLTLCQNTLKGTLQRENFIVYKLYFNKPNLKNINFVTNQTQDGGISFFGEGCLSFRRIRWRSKDNTSQEEGWEPLKSSLSEWERRTRELSDSTKGEYRVKSHRLSRPGSWDSTSLESLPIS